MFLVRETCDRPHIYFNACVELFPPHIPNTLVRSGLEGINNYRQKEQLNFDRLINRPELLKIIQYENHGHGINKRPASDGDVLVLIS